MTAANQSHVQIRFLIGIISKCIASWNAALERGNANQGRVSLSDVVSISQDSVCQVVAASSPLIAINVNLNGECNKMQTHMECNAFTCATLPWNLYT